MKYYVRDWGRPCGVEPKVFQTKEEAAVPDNDDNPFGGPEVLEFDTELEARRFIDER